MNWDRWDTADRIRIVTLVMYLLAFVGLIAYLLTPESSDGQLPPGGAFVVFLPFLIAAVVGSLHPLVVCCMAAIRAARGNMDRPHLVEGALGATCIVGPLVGTIPLLGVVGGLAFITAVLLLPIATGNVLRQATVDATDEDVVHEPW